MSSIPAAPVAQVSNVPRGRSDSAAATGLLDRQRKRLFWPLVLPSLALYAIFMLAPTVATIWISLTRWRAQGDPMVFVGIQNYLTVFGSATSTRAMINTVGILVIAGAAIFVIAFAITIAIRGMRVRRMIRSVLFLPYVVTPIAIGICLGLVLDPTGMLNEGLSKVGLSSLTTDWLAPNHAYWSLMATIIWISTGFYVLILMSGMERIPRHFYEVCELAGASAWQKFRYVTLPLTWDVITIAAVLWVINAFKIFELILAFSSLGSGLVPPETRTMAVDQYYLTVGSRYPSYAMGQGSAVGVLTLVLVAICVVLIRRFMRRERLEF